VSVEGVSSAPRGLATGAAARLAQAGFADGARAAALLDRDPTGSVLTALLPDIVAAAAPDLALTGLLRLAEAATTGPTTVQRIEAARLVRDLPVEPALARRLTAVLGLSTALTEAVLRHPDSADILRSADCSPLHAAGMRADLLDAVGAVPDSPAPVAALIRSEGADALRVAYHRHLLGVAAWDLTGQPDLVEVSNALSDLAGAALEAALSIARGELDPGVDPGRIAVIAMGKCGGRELNYRSDVDVLFVAEPAAALAAATTLATRMMRLCDGWTREGTLWPVDAALRPEGRQGALIRTLSGYRAHWEEHAASWEFQALLKARAVAGDPVLGSTFTSAAQQVVWSAAGRPGFVDEVRRMRERVIGSIPPALAERELKRGNGGLRDVEFAVQLLQLVHGRSDLTVRASGTIPALTALTDAGYVGRSDGLELGSAYRFLRTLEHRLQIQRLQRSHLVPTDEAELRRIGRSLGMRRDPVGGLSRAVASQRRRVRRLHEKLFYRPLLSAVARLPEDGITLAPAAARARLTALGFREPTASLAHLQALTSGVSRRAAIQRAVLPVMLGWFADAPDPDGGLLAFRALSERLGRSPWYLRLLREHSTAAQRLAQVLGSSSWVGELMLGVPETAAFFGDESLLVPRTRAELRTEVLAVVARALDAPTAIEAARGVRRRELVRIAVADIVGQLDVDGVAAALADVTAATVQGALTVCLAEAAGGDARGLPFTLAVVAVGRLGGAETGYGSDADVLFVMDPEPGAAEPDCQGRAIEIASRTRTLLGQTGPHPALALDADLRPEGRTGPLVRSLAAYRAYYSRWSAPWEAQALLRAFPLAGDPALATRFLQLADSVRYPSGGLSAQQTAQIRRLKARMAAERLPRGADPATEVKLGPGGLSDIEWVVQLVQLRHAADLPALRTTRTLPALRAAEQAGLITAADAGVLVAAWRLAGCIRNAAMLVRGRPLDAIPADPVQRMAVARLLGYPAGRSGELTQDWLRTARRSHAAYERLFVDD